MRRKYLHTERPIKSRGGGYFLKIPYAGVVGGLSDPQNRKIQKVPRVLFA